MSNLTEIVDSLESSIGKLLARQEELSSAKLQLEKEIDDLKVQKLQFEEEIAIWTEKCNSLKLANSLLGSDQHKRETKLKINALIREIDQCIVQLSE
jgi:predicted  nucleic acid-binding Zn-ribbon protein